MFSRIDLNLAMVDGSFLFVAGWKDLEDPLYLQPSGLILLQMIDELPGKWISLGINKVIYNSYSSQGSRGHASNSDSAGVLFHEDSVRSKAVWVIMYVCIMYLHHVI